MTPFRAALSFPLRPTYLFCHSLIPSPVLYNFFFRYIPLPPNSMTHIHSPLRYTEPFNWHAPTPLRIEFSSSCKYVRRVGRASDLHDRPSFSCFLFPFPFVSLDRRSIAFAPGLRSSYGPTLHKSPIITYGPYTNISYPDLSPFVIVFLSFLIRPCTANHVLK